MTNSIELSRWLQSQDISPVVLVHELRQPLHIIRWAVEAARLSPTREAACDVIARQVDRMQQLVDHAFEIARLGATTPERQDVDLTQLLQDVSGDQRLAAQHKRLTIAVSRPDQPVIVQGDALQLAQILTNLLSNAVKYTGTGGRVAVSLEYAQDWVTIRISDTGCGIAPEFLPRLFEPFAQAHSGGHDRGLGLGLPIVKAILDQHGGRIDARSDGEGQGAEFIVQLPVS